MSIFGFFLRFTLSYIVIMAVVGIIIGHLGVKSATSLNIPILLGITFWCFYSYSTKNSRLIEGGEKWKLVLTAIAGDILATIILGTPTMLATGTPIKYLLIGMVITLPLHALLFIAVSYGVKKNLVKNHPDFAEL